MAFIYTTTNYMGTSADENIVFTGIDGNLSGKAGNDYLIGSGGINLLEGGSGNDSLLGMGGDDFLVGGDGNDYLSGGVGADVLKGGRGSDRFVFNSADIDANPDDFDLVRDFVVGTDLLVFNYASDRGGIISSVDVSISAKGLKTYSIGFDNGYEDTIKVKTYGELDADDFVLNGGVTFDPSIDFSLIG